MSARTIFRIAHRNLPFSQIGNDMLRDKRLSIEARGALAMILTYPPDWQFNLKWLCDMACVGRDQGRRILIELEKHGYCRRQQPRKSDGTLGAYELSFTDQAGAFSEPVTENQSPETGNQELEIRRRKTSHLTKNGKIQTNLQRASPVFEKHKQPSGTVRDTSETFEQYSARMKREGKWRVPA